MRDISLHLLDILQNSISAKATEITVHIGAIPSQDLLYLKVTDNGVGMEKELLRRVVDPFVTTRKTRPIGLGLPLLKEAAKRSGGDLVITSSKGRGTKVKATLAYPYRPAAPGQYCRHRCSCSNSSSDLEPVSFSNQRLLKTKIGGDSQTPGKCSA